MNPYGDWVEEPYAHFGAVTLTVHDGMQSIDADLKPDEARLLGLRLIKLADKAER